MNATLIRVASDNGFHPPNEGFVKDDPRGREHGRFEMYSDDGKIHITKRGPLRWSCTFDTVDAFKNWATDCT